MLAAALRNGHRELARGEGVGDALPAPHCTCGGPADDGTCVKCGKATVVGAELASVRLALRREDAAKAIGVSERASTVM